MNIENNRMVILDGLRGVAALTVVLFHASLDGSAAAFSRGYVMVDLFFLLSGFILTLSVQKRFEKGLTTAEFVRMRWKRFQPMVISAAIAGSLLSLNNYDPIILVGVTLAACFMIPQGIGDPIYQTNAVQWSLLDELIANGLHAALLHRMTVRTHIAVTSGLCIMLGISIFHFGNANLGASGPTFFAGIIRTLFSYTGGMLLARIWLSGRRPPQSDWRVILAVPCVTILALPYAGLAAWAGDLAAITIALPIFFWFAVGSTPPPVAVPSLALIGRMSFPLYAFHLSALELWRHHLMPGQTLVSGVPLSLLAAWAVAHATRQWGPRGGLRRSAPSQA